MRTALHRHMERVREAKAEPGRWRKLPAVLAAAALALAGLGVNVDSASAENPPTPVSGPDEGGTTVTIPDELYNVQFVKVEAQASGSIGLDTQGNAWSWGLNLKGRLGQPVN